MSFTIHWLSMMINSELTHKLTMPSYKILSAVLSELEIFSEVQQAIVMELEVHCGFCAMHKSN